MNQNKKSAIIDSVFTTVFLGLLIYAAYSLWYIFYGVQSGADVHLYTILSGSALGWFGIMFIKSLCKKACWLKKLIAFLAGNLIFQATIWGFNAKLNPNCIDNYVVIIKTFTITFALSAILLLTAFILKAKRNYKALNIILAAVYFIVSCGGVVVFNADNIKALEYKKSKNFGSIGAEEIMLTEAEKSRCSKWFENSFFSESCDYPFTFKVDGKEFNPSEWEKKSIPSADIEAGNAYRNGKTDSFVLTNKNTGLEVTVEATVFAENATCQWTVYIKNVSEKDSGVISDFYALDSSFETGKSMLYYSIGSDTSKNDFSLVEKNLAGKKKIFSANDGKPTEKYLPYFNINGEKHSMILGIGWSGQWIAGIENKDSSTAVTVKQEHLEAYLLPNEEIRSPLVSVSFYENSNPLKGFNVFRHWVTDCVYPENITKSHYTVMEIAGPESKRTSDEILKILNETKASVFTETDALWMDAGWYTYNEGWYDGVGNWTPDTNRYDNGISELSGYAKSKGIGHVLWYEPERVFPGTQFHNIGSEHEQWLIHGSGDNIMWNLANEDAFDFYCEYLLNSLKENGVTIYRQDFNFAPLEYWQKADAEFYGGRTGICENHYVTNLYRYLDYLCENIDGLIIDNCASGGKRLDLEMTYRSIPFWRSDYNCAVHSDLFEATQSHTYGISFWLPISGSALNMQSEYSLRSDIMPLMLMDFFANTVPNFNLYHEQRDFMAKNYYPIEFGSCDKNKMHAMQYTADDGLSGTAFIYKRPDVNQDDYTVVLNGLVASATYLIYDIDSPDTTYTMSGNQLMTEGITISLPKGEKGIILMFSAK